MYAVRKGRECGIFETWAEAEASVKGFKGAEFKKVANEEEGSIYMSGGVIESKYFYAVRQTGEIFRSWDECKKAVDGKSNMEYRKFKNEDDAKAWIGGNTPYTGAVIEDLSIPTFFIDGSYKDNKIGFGIVMTKNGKETCFRGVTTGQLRNISGELIAFLFSLHTMKELGIKVANVVYDYEGVLKWLTGEWRAKNDEVAEYVKFANEFISLNEMTIYYYKCKSHSGNVMNNKADKLARQATKDGILIPRESFLSERIDISEAQAWS